ncbi:peptide/nickel transport system ATP-binding protein [Alkalibaculum bacchi]|uniref:Peptide/nickel transport system ATP-binding protein n=1 Tax=Alkalibaculum bacchi TaxID=645887 RepID=A0A366I5E5_9FIRM|nr:ATP-binding cassette domain-containing protein [Alkalibaculum bacchi]RBP63285.1 peptide/nickel transport system ATP-binding protein [Alkalibaculum bacchi]
MSILQAKNISFQYKKDRMILEDVNFSVNCGERVGLVAKSGYGKSTLAKILAGHLTQTKGTISIDEKAIEKKGFYPVQLIYQHPEKSINPKWKMKRALKENGDIDINLLEILGIKDIWMDRYPNELSGGELQRIAIARSITKDTKFLIADEITAMLDGITQAQIWQALMKIAEENHIGMAIITHNKALAEQICTRIVYLEEINKR